MKYFCTNCSAEFLRWSGKCSSCAQWDSLVEIEDEKESSSSKGRSASAVSRKITEYAAVKSSESQRISSGFDEFDRVLGGGIVKGSVSLIAGEPGVGKSTLLSQIAINMSSNLRVFYISGEESGTQIYSRIKRLANNKDYSNLEVCEDTNLERIEELVTSEKPDFVIVDSIQSLSSDTVRSFSGSVGQVRVCGVKLTRLAKSLNIPFVIIGQITKEGNVAGPKVLEHIVDTVLQVEGGEYSQFRIVRAVKNRFGATDEIGVFEMGIDGLTGIDNPSQAFLEKEDWGPGSALGVVLRGSRVVFVEVQALVVERNSEVGPLRRVANGIKKPRLDMICAVVSRRGGVYLGDKDVFVNVVGGVDIDDPSLDLAICVAIKAASSDKTVDNNYVYYGEVSLNGGIRKGFSFKSVEKESKRLGYKLVTKSEKFQNIKSL